ncbi:DUF1566 domain-containing protein [Moritella sp. F3]|uniref:Lcl domain-containing protein n=1 Tax=Moritella sp. F3 TaxID=2718882 RepID=UPI0018E1A530|nr:DUF1566 domain-containing protein [Moritella sp. F3]
MKKTALSIACISLFISACDDSNSNLVQTTSKTPAATTTTAVKIKANDITPISASLISFSAPGVTAINAVQVINIKANFGEASIDDTTGEMHFKPYVSDSPTLSAEIIASQLNYQFEISYQIDNNIYTLNGSALPLYNDKSNKPMVRFSKVTLDGIVLSSEDQARAANASDWSCVTDNSSELMWQVPQANGEYAFDATYYWGDRTLNNRDYSEASCILGGDCNTDNLVATANTQKLCGRSDWRLATRTEWQTLLDKKLFDEDSKQSPINNFYFPYVDSNFDEAYWTNSFTIYANGHDNKPVDGDWQGSNSLVGDAHVMWMGEDFDFANMPPRSTNEPHFTMLVNGTVIPDKKDNEVPEITTPLAPQSIANDVDENANWKSRFVKHGPLGQPLVKQESENWACTSDLAYKSALPNTQILWQRISKTEPLKNHAQAVEYAKQVNQASECGQTNWRLPTENELKSLLINVEPFAYQFYRSGYITSVLNDTIVEDDSYYWTSSVDSYKPETKHWAVAFQVSWADSGRVQNTEMYRVRLISTTRLQP